MSFYGFFEGSVEFSKSQKEVVAGSADHRLADPGPFDRAWRGICVGAFYLYAVLMMKEKARSGHESESQALAMNMNFDDERK